MNMQILMYVYHENVKKMTMHKILCVLVLLLVIQSDFSNARRGRGRLYIQETEYCRKEREKCQKACRHGMKMVCMHCMVWFWRKSSTLHRRRNFSAMAFADV